MTEEEGFSKDVIGHETSAQEVENSSILPQVSPEFPQPCKAGFQHGPTLQQYFTPGK